MSPLEENKGVTRRFKDCQGTKHEGSVLEQVLAPGYRCLRAGMQNVVNNAAGQGFPDPGPFLTSAIPDRKDVIEDIIAEEDRVGLLYRITGTHEGNLFGIPATGRRVDIYEIALFRLAEGRITEGWFMADELGLLKQLGKQLPRRAGGSFVVPPITEEGEDPDIVVKRLMATRNMGVEHRNKLLVARWKSSFAQKEDRANYFQSRWGLQHLRDYGVEHGVVQFDPSHAFPGRNDKIVTLIAEGNKVWMRFNLCGVNSQSFYGLPPTGLRCEMPELSISKFVDGKWVEGWCVADGVGIILQLGAFDLLLGLGCEAYSDLP